MKKALLVISNHSPELWSGEQKLGWDRIEYVQFPTVLPDKTTEEIIMDEVTEICKIIGYFYKSCEENGEKGYVNLQGEYTVCYYVYKALANDDEVKFVFPTTDRVVQEVKKEDGTVEKKSVFKFIMWR